MHFLCPTWGPYLQHPPLLNLSRSELMIDFVVLGDSHYHPTAQRDFSAPKMLTRAREVLDASVPAINDASPDFILHNGDLLCGGGSFDLSPADYKRSLRDVAQAYAGFSAPALYVPGNHDCDALTGSFEALIETFSMPRILDVVDVAPRLRVARANLYHGGGTGHWSDENDVALRRADVEARNDGCGLLLMLHEWILPDYLYPGDDPDTGCVHDATRLRATLLERPAAAATFSGHRHLNRLRLWHDILIIDTACLIGYPLGFRQLHLDEEGYLSCRFQVLDCPDLLAASEARSTRHENDRYRGEESDRDTTVLLPRLCRIWQQ